MSKITRARLGGVALLVLLGASVLVRVTNRAGVSPKNPPVCRDLNVWSEKKRIEKLRYTHGNPVTRGLARKEWRWGSLSASLRRARGSNALVPA